MLTWNQIWVYTIILLITYCPCFTRRVVVFVTGCVRTQLQDAGNQELLIYSYNEQFQQDQSNIKVSKIIDNAFADMADRIGQHICWVCSALIIQTHL